MIALLMRGNIGTPGFGRVEIGAPKTILKSRSKDLRKRIRFLCENLYLSTDGANRQREPRMSSQIPTGVWTNRMTTLSQLGQRNIAPMTPP
jgi:hypothetical protein